MTPRKLTPAEEKAWDRTWKDEQHKRWKPGTYRIWAYPTGDRASDRAWRNFHRRTARQLRRERRARVLSQLAHAIRTVWMSDAFWLVVILLLAVFAMAGVVTVIEHMDWVDGMARGER